MQQLRSSLEAMRKLCEDQQIRRLAMPRIGCGLDRLSWEKVAPMIREIFAELDMEIEIYSLEWHQRRFRDFIIAVLELIEVSSGHFFNNVIIKV